MGHRRQTDYHITAVSAVQFFMERAQQALVQDGLVQSTISIPERGCTHLPAGASHNSLLLIDGFFGDSCALEEYIKALKHREIPSAPRFSPGHAISRRCLHVSSNMLVYSGGTLVKACGVVEHITTTALESSQVSCSECGHVLARFVRTEQLVSAITSAHRGSRVEVLAEAPTPSLSDWASTSGFTVSASPRGGSHVLLDTIECRPDTTVPLSRLMRSLWTMPEIVFAVRSDSGVLRYSPAGWCDQCHRTEKKPSRDALRALLEKGIAAMATKGTEASLLGSAAHSVQELLSLPISELTIGPTEPLWRITTALTKLELAHLSLGTATSSLSARDIGALSVAICSTLACEPNALMIFDLPAGIFAYERSSAVKDHLRELGLEHGIVCSADLFSEQTESSTGATRLPTSAPSCGTLSASFPGFPNRLSFELCPGSVITLESSHLTDPFLYRTIVKCLTHGAVSSGRDKIEFLASGTEYTTHPVPVFASTQRSFALLVNELGIGERLAQLYAASLDARALGLSAKDLSLTTARKSARLCSDCRGLGVQLLDHYELIPRPRCSPCRVCQGDRFAPPVGDILFRGIPYSVMLNQPIALSAPILSTLAKTKKTIELLLELELGHLPLGMPLSLLSQSEVRRLRVLQALQGATPGKPAIIVLEEPSVGFRPTTLRALERVRMSREESNSCVWIEVRTDGNGDKRT